MKNAKKKRSNVPPRKEFHLAYPDACLNHSMPVLSTFGEELQSGLEGLSCVDVDARARNAKLCLVA